MFMLLKWAVAFPLLLVAEGAAVIFALEMFVSQAFWTPGPIVFSTAVTLAFFALAAGYMLRRNP